MPSQLAPPAHTPLAVLPAVVLDLETTGLSVKQDRVVQIAAIAMHGAQILETPRIDQVVDPGIPVPPSSTRIHGLGDADVAGAQRFPDVFPMLRDAIRGRVVVGHNVAFDLAVLRHEAARAGAAWRDPPALDVALLVGGLEPFLGDLGLETVASHLGVSIEGRHTAFGDAMAAAEAFARLLPRLREADIRTLGEAQTFAARRHDLVLRQTEAGWHAVPGDSWAPVVEPPVRVDGYVFARRLEESMSSPPVFIEAQSSVREAARTMVEHRIGALLVGAADAPPAGIVTERDLLRLAALGSADLDATRVADAMTTPVECMEPGEMLYRALARMDRLGIRHLCVVDDTGVAVGMVSQRDLLRHRKRSATVLDDALLEAKTGTELAAAYCRVPGVAEQLVAEGLTGFDVAGVVSGEIKALYARAADLAKDRLESEGKGGPPSPWCLLVLGSGGRGESLLGADQDNALIYAGSDADDSWFAAFGALIADCLDEAGVPRCRGGVMAANAEWRGTRETWRRRVENWLNRAHPKDLLNVDIFFDLVPVAGEADLGRGLHAEAVDAASRSSTFLALLAASVQSFAPRFAMFGRLRTEDGRVDLKRDGLLPLVGFARAVAIRTGSTARATPDRLRDAADAGRLGDRDVAALSEIHAELLTHILRQQLVDIQDGRKPSSRVAIKPMSRDARSRLKRQLHRLDDTVRGVRSIMSG